MKQYILGLLLISMLFFGCLGPEGCPSECPEGFIQQEDCTCVPIDTSTSLKEGENTTLEGWNLLVKSISEDAEYDNGTCIISDEKIKIEAVKDNESKTFTLIEQGQEVLSDNLALFIEDINQIFSVEKKGCEVKNKEIKLNVQSSDVSSKKVVVPVTDSTTLSTGTDVEVETIGATTEFVEAFSNSDIYDEQETKELENDIKIKVKSITEDVSIGDMADVTITKDEGEQASLTGDYTIRITDVTQEIGAPDTDVETQTFEEGEDITLDEDTEIEIYRIDTETENCTEDCEIISESVILKVSPEGSGTDTFELNEGASSFVSNRVRVQVTDISQEIECIEEECEITNENVTLRITTYDEECTITNREVDLQLLFPDLTTETFTLGYGDEKVFITGERVKVMEITEDMEDSVNGTCEIDNEEVTLKLTLPSSDCTASNMKVVLEIEDGEDDYKLTLGDEDSETTGRKDNIIILVKEFDIDVEYDEDQEKCVINSEKVSLDVEVEAACFLIKEDATLKYGKSKSDVLLGDSIKVDNIEIELEDIIADVELNDDEDGCDISNKKAELKIMEPISEEFTFEEGEDEDFGDLKLGLNTITFKTQEANDKCEISDKEAELFFEEGGSETTRAVEEGETFTIGQYTIKILEINGETSDDALYTCVITDRQAKLKLIEITAEEILEDAIGENTNETEAENETIEEETQNETQEE
ncbi:MAG: hypothetical protein WC356_01165 [Candidatus Micrarchaeia archaeon]|jgi:hypothetical protein